MLGKGKLGTFKLGSSETPVSIGFAQASSFISKSAGFGQAQTDIKAVQKIFAQAQADIKAIISKFAQAQADIKQVYQSYSQTQTLLNTGFGRAQAKTQISGIVLIQSIITSSSTVTLSNTPTPGNLLVAFMSSRSGSASTYSLTNGTWARAEHAYANSGGNHVGEVWYQIVPPGGLSASTVFTGGSGSQVNGIVEFSGINTSDPFDIAGVVNNNSGATSTTLTPERAETLLFSFISNNRDAGNSFTPVSGMTELYDVQFGGLCPNVEVNYQIVPMATGSAYTVGFSNFVNDQSLLIGVAFTGRAHIGVAQALAFINRIGYGFAQAQTKLNSFNYPQFGQAQADIKVTTNVFAQANAFISKSAGYGQAQAYIKSIIQLSAQAQARLIAFDVNAFAQAQVYIRSDVSFAQAQTWIKATYNQSGQALTFVGHFQSGQAQTNIKATSNAFGQALTFVGHYKLGLAQAKINAFDVNNFGQALAFIQKSAGYANAQASIKKTTSSVANAQTFILPTTGKAQAQAWIKQTYPFVSIDVNYALLSLGAEAQDSTGQLITPDTTIDGQDYDIAPWTMLVATGQYLQIDFFTPRPITHYRLLPLHYDPIVDIQVNLDNFVTHYDWHTVAAGIQLSGDLFEDINTARVVNGQLDTYFSGFGTNLTNAVRIVVVDGGTFNGISLTSVELGTASVKGPTFAQAQAFLGHFGVAQAQAHISPGRGIAYGQAKADIVETFTRRGQANAYIIKPQVYGQANSDILQIGYGFAQIPFWIIPPTVIAQAQATIFAFDVEGVGQAQADIKVTRNAYANAKVFIHKFAGHAQALAQIKSGRAWKIGQARVVIGHLNFSQAQAFISKSAGYGQARAEIKRTFQKVAQAQALIRQVKGYAQAQARIIQYYNYFGFANAVLNQGWGIGQAQARIKHTYYAFGQANMRLKNIATNYSKPYAQAQGMLHIRYYQNAQAQTFINYGRVKVYGQAQTQIGGFQPAQAQVAILGFNISATGQAQSFILGAGTPAPPPSSGAQTYLVKFNDYVLPGYAQEESFDSIQSIKINGAPYIDGSLSEYLGLQNKTITLRMRVWEKTYREVKDKAATAFTMLRSSKGKFAKLYIQHFDKYYLALVKSIKVDKSSQESGQILDYIIEFECRPWLIGNTSQFEEVIILPPDPLPLGTMLTFVQAQAYISSFDIGKHAQAQVFIRKFTSIAQAQARVIGTVNRVGQAQTLIKKGAGYAQANARLIGITVRFAQARTVIKKGAGYAQAQAKLNSRVYRFGQAQVKITRAQAYAQARVVIKTLPGPPLNLAASGGNQTVTLSWQPPAYG